MMESKDDLERQAYAEFYAFVTSFRSPSSLPKDNPTAPENFRHSIRGGAAMAAIPTFEELKDTYEMSYGSFEAGHKVFLEATKNVIGVSAITLSILYRLHKTFCPAASVGQTETRRSWRLPISHTRFRILRPRLGWRSRGPEWMLLRLYSRWSCRQYSARV